MDNDDLYRLFDEDIPEECMNSERYILQVFDTAGEIEDLIAGYNNIIKYLEQHKPLWEK